MKNINGKEISNILNKKTKNKKWPIITAIIIVLGIIGNFSEKEEINEEKHIETQKIEEQQENIVQICDGVTVIKDCELDGIEYILYKYYPPVEEVSHIETITKYKTEIVGYCTLCNDGTRSPSCSTGRGTCSHHDGVAEWNAPIYKEVPYYEKIIVIDTEASPERYEIVKKE